jgi:4-carboxymuconolactone decarboxylase
MPWPEQPGRVTRRSRHSSEERRRPGLFADRERTAFTFADEVLDTSCSSDDTLRAVCGLFSPRQVVELLLLIGYFRMVCGLMTTLEVEVESPFGS